jgi:hypothetical protein
MKGSKMAMVLHCHGCILGPMKKEIKKERSHGCCGGVPWLLVQGQQLCVGYCS